MSEPVGTHVDERGVATLTLQRPEARNAFDAELVEALRHAADAVADDAEVRAVVLTGSQGTFSAGADLRWMRAQADASESANIADAARMEALYRALYTLPKPLICSVDGPALGGGCGLVVVGDVAVATDRSVLGFPEAALGLAPAVISPYVLRRCGPGATRAAFVTARRLSAVDARRLGLVDEVVAACDLDAAVDRWVDAALRAAPGAVAAIKQLLADVEGLSLDAAARTTTELIARLRVGVEGQAGMTAFLDGHRPPWHPL